MVSQEPLPDLREPGIWQEGEPEVVQGVLQGPAPAARLLAEEGVIARGLPVEVEGLDAVEGQAMLDEAAHGGDASTEGDKDRRRRGRLIQDEAAQGAFDQDEIAGSNLVAEERRGEGTPRPAADQKVQVAGIAGATGDGQFGGTPVLQTQQGALTGHEAQGLGPGRLEVKAHEIGAEQLPGAQGGANLLPGQVVDAEGLRRLQHQISHGGVGARQDVAHLLFTPTQGVVVPADLADLATDHPRLAGAAVTAGAAVGQVQTGAYRGLQDALVALDQEIPPAGNDLDAGGHQAQQAVPGQDLGLAVQGGPLPQGLAVLGQPVRQFLNTSQQGGLRRDLLQVG